MNSNRRGLGRGLGALLSADPAETESLVDIPIDQIEVNPNQPRKVFDFTALDELAASIKSSGVIQPIIVRKVSGFYQLIAGERRWRAARQAGLERIPAIVRDATDAQSIELALVENLLREDLNPIETAQAYQKLLAEFGWTQEELAQRIGKDRTSIANGLRLLRLPEDIQTDLRSGRLTMGHARALLALTSVAEQLRLRDEILAHDWSVRTTEDSIRATEADAVTRGLPPRKGRRRSVELAALEEALQRGLMARVRIIGNERRGKIELPYATPAELERLAEALGARH
jgi:ParB family transcriptional regulator, chromosome partitioning protein